MYVSEYSSQVSKRFEKYFSSYHTDKPGHTGRMDRRTDKQTDAGNDNTPAALGLRGKNAINSLRPDDACMCKNTGLSKVQIMA